MKYLCKKSYSKEFVLGKYYNSTSTYDDSYVKIEKLFFIINKDSLAEPKIDKYFYSEKEIRKIKLERLLDIK